MNPDILREQLNALAYGLGTIRPEQAQAAFTEISNAQAAAAKAAQERAAKQQQALASFDQNKKAIAEQFKKVDPAFNEKDFEAAAKTPQGRLQLAELYETVKPRSFVGSTIKLANGEDATVTGVSPYQNNDGFYVYTDKGTLNAYGKKFIENGVTNNKNSGLTIIPSPEMLDQLEKGSVLTGSANIFTDVLDKNNSGLELSKDFYIFNDPSVSNSLSGWVYNTDELAKGSSGYRYIDPEFSLQKGANGKFYYAAQGQNGKTTYASFIHGDRAGVARPFTGSAASSGFSSSGQTVFEKGGIGKIAGILDNPVVQLGVSLIPGGAPLVGAYNAGKVVGGVATGNISGSDALKGLAKAGIAAAVGSIAKGATAGLGSGIGGQAAQQAIQGAIRGGTGALLNGGDLGTGLLSGAVSGGAQGLGSGIGSATQQALAKLFGRMPTSYDLDQGLSGGLDSIAGDLGANYGDYVGGLDAIAGDIGADYLGSTGRNVSLGNFLATVGGGIAPGSMNAQPYSTMNPLTGKEATMRPGGGIGLGGLLAGGALAAGLGRLGSGDSGSGITLPNQPQAGALPSPLNRTLQTQGIFEQYNAGLGGVRAQPPAYEVINPTLPTPQEYLARRGYAAGGMINSGLGATSYARGGMLQGAGDGMSDNIPATIEGKEPVRLADGEYIIPAQAVSALGNGSSNAGAKVLDSMVKNIYKEQTGRSTQMKKMNHSKVLPG